MNTDTSLLEKEIGYSFKNKELLLTALTHSSFYNENKNLRPSNERLEFLGDAVLSVISLRVRHGKRRRTFQGASRSRLRRGAF